MASRIAGVRVNWVLVSAYAVSGTLAGIAGVILAARVTAGIPATGTGYELDSIAAVVVGGASLSGGVGTIGGTALGLFLIQTLNNGFDMLNISSFVQKIDQGCADRRRGLPHESATRLTGAARAWMWAWDAPATRPPDADPALGLKLAQPSVMGHR